MSISLSFYNYFFDRFYFEKKYFKIEKNFYYEKYLFSYLLGLFQKDGKLLTTFYLFNRVNFNLLNSFKGLNSLSGDFYYFSILPFFKFFFTKLKFVFFYFCEKLNKKLYKFAKYKLPRYSFKFYYLKPYKRFNILLKLFSKMTKISDFKTFKMKLTGLHFSFLFNRKELYIFKLLNNLHQFIFKNYKLYLFYMSKTI